ncbi:hypothetical protein [Endozoicomonas ascidiicola]|uniref:hypothetical protein n=1 Tax=Endozoicomonas ascidiicola TaxID=1698521 RepID=UPI0008363D04|nr:hypothetical protein [Endozoicomonas ascidiicola]
MHNTERSKQNSYFYEKGSSDRGGHGFIPQKAHDSLGRQLQPVDSFERHVSGVTETEGLQKTNKENYLLSGLRKSLRKLKVTVVSENSRLTGFSQVKPDANSKVNEIKEQLRDVLV